MERALTVCRLPTAAPVEADAATVRGAVARAWLGRRSPEWAADVRLGAITLRLHQAEAVDRLRAAISSFGGALLADEVGLGKTFVALALARDATRPAVVAPAALRGMWWQALIDAGVVANFVSFEALSRARADVAHAPGTAVPDFVIVDEAHHARNPRTRRYRALARLAGDAPLLLLSATPVHNRRADLTALLALFLGSRARTLDDAELARVVVRRTRSAVDRGSRLPAVAPPRWLPLPADDDLLDAILTLPPPLPPRDAGDGGALLAHSLVRQWASSDAALAAALRRRLASAAAIAASLERGRYPSRGELAAWSSDGDALQLAFAELLVPPGAEAQDADSRAATLLLDAVRRHETAVREVLARVRRSADRDAARAAVVRELCGRHAGEKVVAFASFVETAESLFRKLRGSTRAAVLTARGAAVAGGAITRREAVARFAPLASRAPPPRTAERIDLLLATDLLSEGVSLHDASVVVHLDLPWTPARLEQRVGRVARLGSPHERVSVYALSPPASADALLRTERRLREKLRVAVATVGLSGAILPATTSLAASAGAADATLDAPDASASCSAEEVRRTLDQWLVAPLPSREIRLCSDGGGDCRSAPLVAAVRAPSAGFLALCTSRSLGACGGSRASAHASDVDGAELLLLGAVAPDRQDASDDPAAVRLAVSLADGPGVPPAPEALAAALRALERWAAARRAARDAGLTDLRGASARRRVIERIALITRRAPRHRRAAVAALALDARRAALASCGVGGEWVLEELARADLPDDAWLRALGAFAAAARSRPSPPGAGGTAGEDDFRVVALLLLCPGN